MRWKRAEIKTKGIEGWLDYNFQSSCSLTEEYASFSSQIKKELKKMMKGFEMVSFNRGHFYFSVFFKNIETGKYVYISSDDVRGGRNGWYNSLLVRTAKNDKDYTGGSNDFSNWNSLLVKAVYLTK